MSSRSGCAPAEAARRRAGSLAPSGALLLGALVGAALLAACFDRGERGRPAPATISAAELQRRIQAGTAPPILDVRTPQEYAAGHVPGARNIPHDQVADRLEEVRALQATGSGTTAGGPVPLVVYCRTGRRTDLALPVLDRAGIAPVLSLEGQWLGWQSRGLPAEEGHAPP